VFVAVLSVNCGVLEKQVTKYEGETVELACFTDLNEKVEWGLRSIFQRHLQRTPEGHDEYRRIYTIIGLQRGFNFTERYNVRVGNGYYNLTIKNLNITETGEYICWEGGGQGRRSSTQLSVYGNSLTSVVICNLYLVLAIWECHSKWQYVS
jgi:Immunoglobulin V-set domain